MTAPRGSAKVPLMSVGSSDGGTRACRAATSEPKSCTRSVIFFLKKILAIPHCRCSGTVKRDTEAEGR